MITIKVHYIELASKTETMTPKENHTVLETDVRHKEIKLLSMWLLIPPVSMSGSLFMSHSPNPDLFIIIIIIFLNRTY